jgi:hypothetical protein
MSNPVPYFSALNANTEQQQQQQQQCSVRPKNSNTTIRRHLGLPSKKTFSFVSSQPKKLDFSLPGHSTATTSTTNSILAEIETPKVLEKQLIEINQPHFLNLAAASTAETLAKVANKRARQYNPFSKPNAKKRKPDIFDF